MRKCIFDIASYMNSNFAILLLRLNVTYARLLAKAVLPNAPAKIGFRDLLLVTFQLKIVPDLATHVKWILRQCANWWRRIPG